MSEANLPGGFVAALRDLSSWLDAARVPYVLIGGVSVSLLAQPRATQDIDITVWLDDESWQDFFDAAEGFNFEPRLSDPLAFAAASRVLLPRHRESGVSLDVAFGALDFEREMIERAAVLDVAGLRLPLPTPEDLIVTKAVAQRPKDTADIEAILNARQDLDLARIRRLTAEFAAALGMPEISNQLEDTLRRCRPPEDKD